MALNCKQKDLAETQGRILTATEECGTGFSGMGSCPEAGGCLQ